jgi:hypothetical protein
VFFVDHSSRSALSALGSPCCSPQCENRYESGAGAGRRRSLKIPKKVPQRFRLFQKRARRDSNPRHLETGDLASVGDAHDKWPGVTQDDLKHFVDL